jgi:hypothetical protein
MFHDIHNDVFYIMSIENPFLIRTSLMEVMLLFDCNKPFF